MKEENLYIDCHCHGRNNAAVVCGHLIKNNGPRLGFIENSSDQDELQGWCFACEHYFLEEGNMTENFKVFNNMSVICSSCYIEIKENHEIIS